MHSCSLPVRDFVQVTGPGQLASDFVVDVALPVEGRCVAYAPSDGTREAIPIDPDEPLPVAILPAAVVCVQPEHDPMVVLPTAFEHLQTLQHTLAATDPPGSGSSADSSLALFLGFGFDHFLVDLAPGSVLQRLSEALQLPRSDIFILRQWPTFESLEIAGRRPRTCFGFRNVRDLGRPFRGLESLLTLVQLANRSPFASSVPGASRPRLFVLFWVLIRSLALFQFVPVVSPLVDHFMSLLSLMGTPFFCG